MSPVIHDVRSVAHKLLHAVSMIRAQEEAQAKRHQRKAEQVVHHGGMSIVARVKKANDKVVDKETHADQTGEVAAICQPEWRDRGKMRK